MKGHQRERGSASVLVLAIGSVVLMVGLASALAGSVIAARQRAHQAADFAALAAAGYVQEGRGKACDHAAQVASANGARMTSCRLDGCDAIVTVVAALPTSLKSLGLVTATARAGPS